MNNDLASNQPSLDDELLRLATDTEQALELPGIHRVVLPQHMLSVSEARAKHDKFGLVILEDGSAGFFYRLLQVELGKIDDYRHAASALAGKSISSAVANLHSDDLFIRALALGVVNATTQALFRRSGFQPPGKSRNHVSADAGAKNSTQTSAPIGMVGFFRQQIDTLLKNGHKVVVLELNDEFHTRTDQLLVTNDIETLRSCDTVFCTASTLINGTLESLLQSFHELKPDMQVEVVGPSAGCFPDALFARGVSVIGGSLVDDCDNVREKVRDGEPWLQAVSKFTLRPQDYPGQAALIHQALHNQTPATKTQPD